MVMTKLFNKFLTASATALAVFCSFACSDKIAGTAEEPNQCAFGDESSSSSDRILIPDTSNGISSGTENSQKPISSSSYINSLPGFEISSSSAPEHHDIIPTPAQSSSEMASDGGGKAGFPEFGNPDCIAYTEQNQYHVNAAQAKIQQAPLTNISINTALPKSLTTTTLSLTT